MTILLGDFNAAFLYQTEDHDSSNFEGADFLKEITGIYRFVECTAKEECDDALERIPHYTYSKDGLGRKYDHIFISKSLFKLLKEYNGEKPYEIGYIDEVNLNPPKQLKKEKPAGKEAFTGEETPIGEEPISPDPYAFTDHSGIKLTIELPDPETDSKQAEASAP